MKKRVFSLEYSGKKGQITIFIILGILILLSAISFYVIIQKQREILQPGVIPSLKTIPSEFSPIRNYIQDCLEKVATDGLRKLGQRGGYISPEQHGLITMEEHPTESDAIQFSPNSDLKVAYWWYLKASNTCKGNCLFSSARPELYREKGTNSIEIQLDNYIKENLPLCLNNFADFRIQGYEIQELGEIKPETIIANEDVAVQLDYPLKITKAYVTAEVNDYFARIPINLKQMYDFATEITNAEIKYDFLEKNTMNLVSSFSNIDVNKLPPIGDTDIRFSSPTTWSEAKIKDKIEDMLMSYIPIFQIYYSLNYVRRVTAGGTEAIYEMMEIPINLEGEFDDYEVAFTYLKWWPIYFDVNSRGDIIQPETLSNPIAKLFTFVVHRYVTAYDISYPVIIDIKDPNALYGQGYTFRIALEANIRNNEAVDEDFEGLEGARAIEPSLFCNYNQRNSGNITIDVKNKVTNEPAENTLVRYDCGADSCIMGYTDFNGRLESKFPICYNGIASFSHPDYLPQTQALTTKLNKEKNILIQLYPYTEKQIKIKKYIYSNRFDQLAQQPTNLNKDEWAVITLSKDDFSAFAQYTENQTAALRLIPGKYEADIKLFTNQRIYIPPETRRAGILSDIQEYIIPAVEFNESYQLGGALFNINTGLLEIKSEDLYNSNVLEIYIISHEIPTKVEHIGLIGDIEAQTARFRSYLEPKWK